jgi:ABC-type bacteriocin/lantibiotic exporter with double-glycine peptidase domain
MAPAPRTPEGDPAATAPLSRLWQLLAVERKLVVSIYVYAALAGLFGLTLPLGVQAIIGLVSGGLILQPVVLLVAFVVLGTLANGLLQLLQLSVVERVQQRVFARLAMDLAGRMQRVRLDQLPGVDLAELMNRFFEVKTIQKSLGKLLTDWVAAGLQVLAGLLLLTFYHPYFSLFGAVLLGGLGMVFFLTAPRGWSTSLGESKHKYRVAHWLQELARSFQAFRFADRPTLPAVRMEDEVSAYLGYRVAHFRVLVTQSAAFVIFKTLITAGLLVLGTTLVVDRQITLGQFVASEIVIVTVLLAVEKLILGLADVYDILTALEKAEHATRIPVESEGGIALRPAAGAGGMALSLRDLSFTFGQAPVGGVQGVSFGVASGERVAIVGAHGSGVTTVLQVAAGLLQPYAGAATIDGMSWRDLDLSRARAQIAWCGHEPDLFDGTIEENIALGRPGVEGHDVAEIIGRVGLDRWVAGLPEGLRTVINVGGRRLPVDIIVRLQVARALVGAPRLVVLDRALDVLDPADRAALLPLLFPATSPWSCLVASNDWSVLRMMDRIIRMDGGRVAVDGPAATVLDSDPWCRQLVRGTT